jgi:hypothetical protein
VASTIKINEECGSIAKRKGETDTKIDIGPSKFKTSNLPTKHKHLRGIVQPSLKSDFVPPIAPKSQ